MDIQPSAPALVAALDALAAFQVDNPADAVRLLGMWRRRDELTRADLAAIVDRYRPVGRPRVRTMINPERGVGACWVEHDRQDGAR